MPERIPAYIRKEQAELAAADAAKKEEELIKKTDSFFPEEPGPLEKARAEKEQEIEDFLEKFSKEKPENTE